MELAQDRVQWLRLVLASGFVTRDSVSHTSLSDEAS
jgi:hypothetical protein